MKALSDVEADQTRHGAESLPLSAPSPSTRARLIAFYLPQFQPTPENDEWWGKGFTEWTNVTKATPLFPGHFQPRLPADLGFYDLRVPETRAEQANLAQEYGIEAFCYWHYWFHGRRILERVETEILQGGEPRDFPFCLGWANHTWSRSWLGDQNAVLLEQTYSDADDREHARYLARAFADPRYLRVDGRPVFVIYDHTRLPAPQRTTDTFRDECVRRGVGEPLLLAYNLRAKRIDARTLGFDGTIDSQPQFASLPPFNDDWGRKTRLKRFLTGKGLKRPLRIFDYQEVLSRLLGDRPDYPFYPSIFVGWDNTARRGREATVMINATPAAFAAGLTSLIDEVEAYRPWQERLIFVNAWNEWGEGMYLEPDQKFGRGFLDAIRSVNVLSTDLRQSS